MKLLVFAHTPPPHHGQSHVITLLLAGFGGDWRRMIDAEGWGSKLANGTSGGERHCYGEVVSDDRIKCYHVNARFSKDIADMGRPRLPKLFLVFRYCFEAIWCRFRFGVTTFLFCPAPPKRLPLYRDWLVMLMCRPFFHHFVHYWQGAGLGDWLECEATPLERWLSRRLMGKASLGIALAVANTRDPLWFATRQVAVVPNGIEDPFPDFTQRVLPRREARREARQRLLRGEALPHALQVSAGGDPQIFRLLYLAHCFRGKGIFETLEGVAIAQSRLIQQGAFLRIHLTVAGDFASAEDRAEFNMRVAQKDLQGIVHYAGFVRGAEKERLLIEGDCLCFPTYFEHESFGLVVLEAMAAGMNVIATRWRALPEILPTEHRGFVPPRDPAAIAAVIPLLFAEDAIPLRTRFLEQFTMASYLEKLNRTIRLLKLSR